MSNPSLQELDAKSETFSGYIVRAPESDAAMAAVCFCAVTDRTYFVLSKTAKAMPLVEKYLLKAIWAEAENAHQTFLLELDIDGLGKYVADMIMLPAPADHVMDSAKFGEMVKSDGAF